MKRRAPRRKAPLKFHVELVQRTTGRKKVLNFTEYADGRVKVQDRNRKVLFTTTKNDPTYKRYKATHRRNMRR